MSDPGTNDCYEVISQKQGIPTRIVNLVEKGRAYYKAWPCWKEDANDNERYGRYHPHCHWNYTAYT